MNSTPIGDAAEQIQGKHDGQAAVPNHARAEAGYPLYPYKASPTDFMGDLLDAQHEFIAAQHKFMKDADMTALVIAQTELVNSQGFVITRLLSGPGT